MPMPLKSYTVVQPRPRSSRVFAVLQSWSVEYCTLSSAFDGGAWAVDVSVGACSIGTRLLTTSEHLEEFLLLSGGRMVRRRKPL